MQPTTGSFSVKEHWSTIESIVIEIYDPLVDVVIPHSSVVQDRHTNDSSQTKIMIHFHATMIVLLQFVFDIR